MSIDKCTSINEVWYLTPLQTSINSSVVLDDMLIMLISQSPQHCPAAIFTSANISLISLLQTALQNRFIKCMERFTNTWHRLQGEVTKNIYITSCTFLLRVDIHPTSHCFQSNLQYEDPQTLSWHFNYFLFWGERKTYLLTADFYALVRPILAVRLSITVPPLWDTLANVTDEVIFCTSLLNCSGRQEMSWLYTKSMNTCK